MEQDHTPHLDPSRTAVETKDMSLVDCLFEMPKVVKAKRVSETERAAGARLEARLSSEIRKVIATRLRGGGAA